MMTWAAVLKFLTALIKPLVVFFAYLAGKKAQRSETAVEQGAKDLSLAEDYLKNRSEDRSPEKTLEKIKDGSF